MHLKGCENVNRREHGPPTFLNHRNSPIVNTGINKGSMEVNMWAISVTLFVIIAGSIDELHTLQQAVGYLPGLTIPLQPIGFPGVYSQRGVETVSLVPFIFGDPAIITSNIDVAKQFLAGSTKSSFGKPEPRKLAPIAFWGISLFVSDGDAWKRHRRVVGPSFSNKLYELVWSEVVRTYSEMVVAEGFEDKKVVEIPAVQSLTTKLAFLIIGRCGFGFPFSWAEPIRATGSKMAFPQAIRVYMRHLLLLYLPSCVRSIPLSVFSEFNASVTEIRSFMEHKIREKQKEVKSNRGQQLGNDIFSVLVQANDAEADPKLKLDDSEVISNVFTMLFAGHETTAHTMAATIACLAKDQIYQQEVFEQIQCIVGNAREPTFEDYSKLDKVQASFYESLRLFPTGYLSIREAHHDTLLHIPDTNGEGRITTIHVAKGTQVLVDNIGINYNPRYFEDPQEFKPSRWHGITNESESYYAFGFGKGHFHFDEIFTPNCGMSIGPRACIGRKFAMSEAVCLLTMLLRDWKIEPLLQDNETVDAWYGKLFSDAHSLVTLAIANVSIRLVRRAP
ncbi:cytochrome P450 [Cyathus striatus]|nr:cytochrome P450 [Cyathus striatus]